VDCSEDSGTDIDDLAQALQLALGYSRRHRRFALKAFGTALPAIAARTRLMLQAAWAEQRRSEAAIRSKLLTFGQTVTPALPPGLMISPQELDYALFAPDALARIVLASAEEADAAARDAQSHVCGPAQDGLRQILRDHRAILAMHSSCSTACWPPCLPMHGPICRTDRTGLLGLDKCRWP
jgi:hypothetical protein